MRKRLKQNMSYLSLDNWQKPVRKTRGLFFGLIWLLLLLHQKALDLSISTAFINGGTAQAVFLRFYFAQKCRTAKFQLEGP